MMKLWVYGRAMFWWERRPVSSVIIRICNVTQIGARGVWGMQGWQRKDIHQAKETFSIKLRRLPPGLMSSGKLERPQAHPDLYHRSWKQNRWGKGKRWKILDSLCKLNSWERFGEKRVWRGNLKRRTMLGRSENVSGHCNRHSVPLKLNLIAWLMLFWMWHHLQGIY